VGVGHDISAHHDLWSLPSKVARVERHKVIGGDQGIPIKENRILGRPATAFNVGSFEKFPLLVAAIKGEGTFAGKSEAALERGRKTIETPSSSPPEEPDNFLFKANTFHFLSQPTKSRSR
jgi:hypothetical protein